MIGLLTVCAFFLWTLGEVRGDPPENGDWFIEGNEKYANETFTITGNLQINQTNSLSLYNVTLIFNNSVDLQFTLNIFGAMYMNSSTIKSVDAGKRMGDTDIDGRMECRDSLIQHFADFRLYEGANFYAENTTFSDGRRLLVTQDNMGSVILENSSIKSTGNPSNIIINDEVLFRDVVFPDDEISFGLNGELTIQHFLDIYVNDTEGKVMDDTGILIESDLFKKEYTTDANGLVNLIPLTEYIESNTKRVYDEKYSVTASKLGYFDNTMEVRMNKSREITITLNPLPDPYVEEDDIDIPLKPNEGDIMNINVSLHNIGENASVKAKIYLEDYTGKQTLLKSENLDLEEGVTSYIETQWDTTPERAGEYAIVVDIENKTADRNTTNNSAEKEFYLAAIPIVIAKNITTNTTDVFRRSSAAIGVNGEDRETDEWNLTLKIQAHPSSGGLWDDSYFSEPYWNGSIWISNFTPSRDAELGDWDFRFRFTDENNGVSGWETRRKFIFVMNNLPVITDIIPDFSIEEDNDLILDMTNYEEDREDSGTGLNWFIQSYKENAIQTINGQNSTNDVLTFVPVDNFTGNTSVVIVLVDKDGGTDSQLFHINWTSVNDAPILENASFSTMEVLRTDAMVIHINATDDNTSKEDVHLDFQLRFEGDIGWTDVNFNIATQFVNDHWRVSITPATDANAGNYSLRFNITDDDDDEPGRSRYYYYSIKVLNNLPEILDITPESGTVLRTSTLVFTFNGSDTEDTESILQPVMEYRYKKYAYNTFNDVWFDAANGSWSFNFTPSASSGIGNYTFRARFMDTDGGESDWMEAPIVVRNNHPVAINLSIPLDLITVNNTIYAYANGSDIEELESKLTPFLELRAEDGAAVWFSDYVIASNYNGDIWIFTIRLPENSTLGDYSFRIYFADDDGNLSNNVTEIDALHVINNQPIVLNMGVPALVHRTETAILYANAKCDLNEEDELDPEFQYYHLGSWHDSSGAGSFLGDPIYENFRWEVDFTPDALDSTMGNYSFRVRFKLRESDWSSWFYLQNGSDVVNSIPVIEDLEFNATEVYRGNELTITITVEDAEDPDDELNLTLEYSIDLENWETTYLSALTLAIDQYIATFTPLFSAGIGNYSFRVMGTDTENDSTEWLINSTNIWVMNNPPIIVGGSIPEQQYIEDNDLQIDLTEYEGDKEDDDLEYDWLDWEVVAYDSSVITKIRNRINYDVFWFTPAENFTGTTIVTFKLVDSDGGYVLVNASLTWASVNDEPVIEKTWTDNTTVLRDEILTIYIQALDDDDPAGNLTPVIHYTLDGDSWINASVTHMIVGSFENGTIVVNHTVPTTVTPGNYSIRVKVMDTSGNRTENSTWHYLPGTVEFRNHLPELIYIDLQDTEVNRTHTIPVYVDAWDKEDNKENLSLELAYSYDYENESEPGTWTPGYAGNVYYDDSSGYLVIEFIPGKDAKLGLIFLRARVVDTDGGKSFNWTDVVNITVLNNVPEFDPLPWFTTEEDNVLVVNLTDYGSDAENDPSELRWSVSAYNSRVITNITGNGTTELRFIPMENFTGVTIISLLLEDLDGANVSTSTTLEWIIIYEPPRVIEYILEENFVYRETTLTIIVTVNDDDDDNASLVGSLEYLPPGGGDWIDLTITYKNSIWSTDFIPGPDWVTGVYTLRVRFQDTDELDSPWLWTNITVLSNPMVEDFSGPDRGYRTKTVRLYVNGSDANDDEEWELTPHFGYSRSNVTYSSNFFGAPWYENGAYNVNFTPGAGLEVDLYYIRVRFNDTDGAVSEWAYIMMNIRNNAPVIVGTVPDDNAVEDNSINLDLLNYGSDSEDPADELNWTAEWNYGISSVMGNGSRNLEVIPLLDFTGATELVLTLHDRDGAIDTQSIDLIWTPVNDAPRITVLELASDTTDLIGDYIFHTGSNLSAILHDPMDPEGNDITVYYSWLVNENYIIENLTTATTFGRDNFERGDMVNLRVLLTDDTDERYYENSTLIGNAPPTIEGVDMEILYMGEETDKANESTILRVTPIGYFDLDEDPLDYDNFSYEWYNGGIMIVSGLDLREVNGSYFDKDDEIWCRILPYDGMDYGLGERSSTIHIFNTPPFLGYIPVEYNGGEPFGPNEHSKLFLTFASYFDADRDPLDNSSFLYSWFVNTIEIPSSTPTLASDFFVRGDQVYCVVTPFDGEEYGEATQSDTVTILNTPPTIVGAVVNHTGLRPDKHSTLSVDISGYEDPDGDPPDLWEFAYEWYSNNELAGTDSTLNLMTFNKGDEIYCSVTPHDGSSSGDPVTTDTITVLNTPPTFSGSSIIITYDDEIVTKANLSSILTAVGDNYFDEDIDPEQTARYAWFIDDNFAKTGNTIDSSYFSKGERVYCVVEPYDGTNYGPAVVTPEVTIENTPPEISDVRVITLGQPSRVATFTAELIGYYDEDNDPQDVHKYNWYVNGDLVTGQSNSTFQNALGDIYFTKGDAISVKVWPFDGTDYGNGLLSSNSVVIINTAPILNDGIFLEWEGELNATSVISVNTTGYYIDPDGDFEENYYYEWFVNSKSVATYYNYSKFQGFFVNLDRVSCRVTPNDGEDNGSAVFTKLAYVTDSPPEIYGSAILIPDTTEPDEYSTIQVVTTGLRTADIDGDSASFVFVWYVNDILAGAPQEKELTGFYFDKGDQVHCKIFAFDGTLMSQSSVVSESIEITNTAPVAVISKPLNNSFGDVQRMVKLDASGSFDPDSGDELLYRWQIDGVQVGGDDIKLGVMMTPGHHNIKLEVFDDDMASDTAEVTIYIKSSDLMITKDRIIFSGTTYVDKTITFVVDIGNIGDGDATNVSVSFYVDNVLIGTVVNQSLGSDNNETVSFSWKAVEGKHTVRVVLDKDNLNLETDENNNEAEKDIEITKESKTDEPLFGINEQYLYIMVVLMILAIVLGFGDIISWKRGTERTPKRKTKRSKKEGEPEKE